MPETLIKKSQFTKLERLGIRHFDELIHDQSKDWLIKNFKEGSDEYPINVSRLIRNIIWQTRKRIQKGEREPIRELIRTFWYTHIKPTLARVGALSKDTDQYAQLIDNFVLMVVERKLMKYSDIGFRDDNRANRKVGINSHVILFSEKLGHQEFLGEIAEKYNISIIALGGQPSALNVEYFVDEMKDRGIDIRRSFYLFSIVDYDTSGWIIRDAFVNHLAAFGVKNTKVVDLIHPDMLKPHEIVLAKYPIPESKVMKKKNTAWLREVRKRRYANQRYLLKKDSRGDRIIYGLEAESISAKRIERVLEEKVVPLLDKSEDILRIQNLEKINESIKELILLKI